MNKLLFGLMLSLAGCALNAAIHPEDQSELDRLKADVKGLEIQVKKCHAEIAAKNEEHARKASAFVVREAESRKKTLEDLPEAAQAA